MPMMTKQKALDLCEQYADLPPAEFAKATVDIWARMASMLDEPMTERGARQFFHVARTALPATKNEPLEP